MEMSQALEDLLHSTIKLRQTLSKVLPPEAVDYIIDLVTQDLSHRKFLKLIED